MPQINPLPAPVPLDVLDQLRELMARSREEVTAALRTQLEASGELAEERERNIRYELKLIMNEMEIDQD